MKIAKYSIFMKKKTQCYLVNYEDPTMNVSFDC